MVPECCVCHVSFGVVCDVSEYCMLVCVSLSINVCMFTVSNALLTSNHTTIVLLMLCSAMLVECLVLNPCCVVWYALCFIMEESPSQVFFFNTR